MHTDEIPEKPVRLKGMFSSILSHFSKLIILRYTSLLR
jgi:hypothetical protein